MTFDPSTLAGNRLWLRAKDLTVGAVTSWPDQSGWGHDGTGTGTCVATSTPLGGRSVGSNSFSFALSAAPPTITATASSNAGGSWVPANAFDGVPGGSGYAWASGSLPAWLQAQITTAAVSTGYTLQGRTDDNTQTPTDWTFLGSNDGSTWTTLDTQTAQTFTAGQLRHFTFINSTAYAYHRINITAVNGGPLAAISDLFIDGINPYVTNVGAELWAVIKSAGGQTSGWSRFSAAGSASHYPYTSGTVYEGFGGVARQSFSPTLSTTDWRILRVANDGSTWQAWLDGTSQATASSVAVSLEATATLGHSSAYAGGNWAGNIAELLVRDQVSTSGEVADMMAYLTAEHLAASTPATTGTAPVSVGTSSWAALLATTTGLAPVSAASSSDASTSGPLVASGLAPVGVASSSSVSMPGVLVTTGMSPVEAEASADASTLIPTILTGWAADLSQRTLLDLVSVSADLDYTPPKVLGSGVEGLPPMGYLALPPVALTERALTRCSVSVPAMVPGADHRVHISDVAYAAYPTTRAVVGVPHVLVDGIDVTYLRGAPIGIGADHREAPFGDVSLVLDFPMITPQEAQGGGSLSWLRPEAPVELVMLDGDSMVHLWAGELISDDGGNDQTASKTSWTASGTMWRASTFGHRVPTILDPTDIGTVIPRALNGVVARTYPAIANVATGINTLARGASGDSELAHCQGLLATAWTSLTQWTVAKVNGTARTYAMRLKDTTTVHHTVTVGVIGVEVNLSKDKTSTANALYGRGITPSGQSWAGWCYPNFGGDSAPSYPFNNPAAVISIGTTDADTDSGTGVSDLQRRFNELNLGPDVTVDGVFNSSDAAAARDVQAAYGLSVDGAVAGQTWAATFDVGGSGADLGGAYRRPLAIATETEPHLYAANGAILADNPDYTGARRWERDTDYGPGTTRAASSASARLELARDKLPGLVGTITLSLDPREGSMWLIAPGQNIRLLGYNGGDPLLHIVSVDRDWSGLKVSLTVDEHARDAMTVAEIQARNKEAQVDPARRPGRTNRRSRQEFDLVTPFDGESPGGRIPRHALYGGLWTVIRIPVSEQGSFAKVEIHTSSPVSKFCVAMFSSHVTPAHLLSLVGNPLTGTDPFGRTPEAADALDDLGLLEALGGPGSAAGYWPGQEGSAVLSGRLKDTGGMNYNSARPPWLWFAEFSPVSTFIQGRVFPSPIQ